MMRLRWSLLALIAAVVCLMAVPVVRYPALLALPGASVSLTEPALVLAVYAAVVIWATRARDPGGPIALSAGTPVGLVAAAVESSHIAHENFSGAGPRALTIVTGLGMFALIALFATA